MHEDEAARAFCAAFHDLFLRFHDRRAAEQRQVSPEALSVLQHLAQSGPLTITEACAHFSRSQAAMSEIVTRLERRGLLQRFADERDRRRTLVFLSDEGLAAWRASQHVLDEAVVSASMLQLRPAERAAAVAALERLLSINPKTTKDKS